MTDGMWMTALLFLSLLNTAAGRQFLAVQTSYAWILWSKGQIITNISAVNIVEETTSNHCRSRASTLGGLLQKYTN